MFKYKKICMLKIENLNLEINSKKILSGISFEVSSWEIFNILGHNGSGKTSLLKSIIWLNKVSWDVIFSWESLSDLNIPSRSNKGISYIMQEIPEYTGIPVESYLKNILKDKFDLDKVSNLFEDFGINYEVYKTRYFDSHLSGGERKKVEIITNFLMDKDLYLLDEIEASLDATSRDVLIKLILKENKAGKTFIIVSHSKDILGLASKWILLCDWNVDATWENSKLLGKYFWSCKWCSWDKCKK